MTRNQKLALRNITLFFAIKVGVTVAVHFATKALIKKLEAAN